MHIDILTLFPQMFAGVFEHSIVQRAQAMNLVTLGLHNLRDYADDKHQLVDDIPYGGGGGMVMKPEPIFQAVETILEHPIPPTGYVPSPAAGLPPIILLTPQGAILNHATAKRLARYPRFILLCGRYEGIDERVAQYLATEYLSIGDYVLSGGEIAAMVVVEAVVRLLPGALGDPAGAANDSHAMGLLEYPHYTRPADFRGQRVPDILLSGDHPKVARWRRQEALRRTWERRPDLLATAPLSDQDRLFLAQLAAQKEAKG